MNRSPAWAILVTYTSSTATISGNVTLSTSNVGVTRVVCYYTSSSSTYTISLPSSGTYSYAYQISNSYYNGAVVEVSSAKSGTSATGSNNNPIASIKGNGKYTSIMIIYTRTA